MIMSQNDIGPSPEWRLTGRVVIVGNASTIFGSRDLERSGCAADDPLLVIRVDRDNSDDPPIGLCWAENIEITLKDQS